MWNHLPPDHFSNTCFFFPVSIFLVFVFKKMLWNFGKKFNSGKIVECEKRKTGLKLLPDTRILWDVLNLPHQM